MNIFLLNLIKSLWIGFFHVEIRQHLIRCHEMRRHENHLIFSFFQVLILILFQVQQFCRSILDKYKYPNDSIIYLNQFI